MSKHPSSKLDCGCKKGNCTCDPDRHWPPVCCNKCPMTHPSQDWAKRLDTVEFGFDVDGKKLKEFIREQISLARKQGAEEERKELIEEIEEWVKEYDKSYMGNPDSWAEKPGNNYTAGELVSYGWGVADLVDKLLDFLSKEAELGGKE